MSLFGDRGEPTWINPDTGHKWWKDKDLTEWCTREDVHGKSPLVGARGWYVECPDGHKTYLITMGDAIVIESQSLESVACEIDMLKFVKRSAKK